MDEPFRFPSVGREGRMPPMPNGADPRDPGGGTACPNAPRVRAWVWALLVTVIVAVVATIPFWIEFFTGPIRTLGKPRGEESGVMHSVSFSPDGRFVGSIFFWMHNKTKDGENYSHRCFVWDAKSGEEVLQVGRLGEEWISAVFLPGSLSDNRRTEGMFIREGRALALQRHIEGKNFMDGKRMVELFDLDKRVSLKRLEGGIEPVVSQDGRWMMFSREVAVPGKDGEVEKKYVSTVLDLENGKEILKVEMEKGSFGSGFFFSPGGNHVGITIHSGRNPWGVQVWNLEKKAKVGEVKGRLDVLSPSGKYLAGWVEHSPSSSLSVYSVPDLRETARLTVPDISDPKAFSPDDRILVVDTYDSLDLWDIETKRKIRSFPSDGNGTKHATFSPDGRFLATLRCPDKARSERDNSLVCVWDVRTGKEVFRLYRKREPISPPAFSPDSRLLATGMQDGTVLLWRMPEQGSRPGARRRAATPPPPRRPRGRRRSRRLPPGRPRCIRSPRRAIPRTCRPRPPRDRSNPRRRG
ncbi:MAG: WD40 repeat domain-containing protein [Planctomycetota bacterium]